MYLTRPGAGYSNSPLSLPAFGDPLELPDGPCGDQVHEEDHYFWTSVNSNSVAPQQTWQDHPTQAHPSILLFQ